MFNNQIACQDIGNPLDWTYYGGNSEVNWYMRSQLDPQAEPYIGCPYPWPPTMPMGFGFWVGMGAILLVMLRRLSLRVD